MAANLLVRRSTTARLLCLVRSQVASFATESRSPSSEPFITTGSPGLTPKASYPVASMPADDEAYSRYNQYCKKFNLLKDTRSIDEILDDDKEWQNFYGPTGRYKATKDLWHYWRHLMSYGHSFVMCSFKEHLLKHCSHRKIQLEEAFKFKEAFSMPISIFVNGPAKAYYWEYNGHRCGPRRKLFKVDKDMLLRKIEREKKEGREFNRRYFADEVMREIEEDITKKVNEITVKAKVKKVNEEMVASGDPGMATPC